MPLAESEQLPGYVVWLPNRVITLHRHQGLYANERLKVLETHWRTGRSLDRLALDQQQ